MTARRACIVFEEGDADLAFKVKLEGIDLAKCQAMTDQERRQELSAAEFWCFEIFARIVVPLRVHLAVACAWKTAALGSAIRRARRAQLLRRLLVHSDIVRNLQIGLGEKRCRAPRCT